MAASKGGHGEKVKELQPPPIPLAESRFRAYISANLSSLT